jgi:hypothetical protein
VRTPGTAANARSTRATQEAQLIDWIDRLSKTSFGVERVWVSMSGTWQRISGLEGLLSSVAPASESLPPAPLPQDSPPARRWQIGMRSTAILAQDQRDHPRCGASVTRCPPRSRRILRKRTPASDGAAGTGEPPMQRNACKRALRALRARRPGDWPDRWPAWHRVPLPRKRLRPVPQAHPAP